MAVLSTYTYTAPGFSLPASEAQACPAIIFPVGPVYDRYFADPFTFQHEGVYYAVGTAPTPLDSTSVFQVLRSADLESWEPMGLALERPDVRLGTDFWAPEIAATPKGFFMYYSLGFEDKLHHVRVAFSERPEGPYRDMAALTDTSQLQFAIDASPFQDSDGQWYLYYAVDFLDEENGCRPGTALVVDRLANMHRLAGDPRVVARATQEWQRYQWDRPMYGASYDWHTLEGPFVVKRQGRYWCFYSGGNWQNETYGVDYCVADHPLGPFSRIDSDTPRVLKTIPGSLLGPGHNSIVQGPDGADYIVYHAWFDDERKMCIDRLEWTPEGPRARG